MRSDTDSMRQTTRATHGRRDGAPDDVGDERWIERLQLAALDRAPGRLAEAARIAPGRTRRTTLD